MTSHMPPLRYSPNSWRSKTVAQEYGRKNENEPRFDGHWVIRECDGTLIDYYKSKHFAERFYSEAVVIAEVHHDDFPGYRS